MQIHELPSGTLSTNDVTAIDNGTSTRKYSIGSAMGRALIRDTASLDTGTDLNDISMGIHYCAGSKTYSNMPGSATYGTIIHIAGTYPVQMFFTTSTMYYRMYANSQWYAWNRIQIQS